MINNLHLPDSMRAPAEVAANFVFSSKGLVDVKVGEVSNVQSSKKQAT